MSAGDTRAAFLKLRFQFAKSDVLDAARLIRKLQYEYTELDAAQKEAQRSNVRGAKALGQTAQGYKQVGTNAKQAAAEVKKLASAQDTFLSADIQQQLRRARTENRAESFAIRGALGAIPGGGGALGQGAADIFNLIDAIPELNLSFKVLKASILENVSALGVGGVGLIAAFAALAAAMAFFNAQNEKAAQSIRNLIATQEEYYKIIGTGTRAQLEAAREAAQNNAEILRARIDENKRLLNGLRDEAGEITAVLADVFNLAGAKELREETQRLEAELQQAELLENRYTTALENNATAASDLIAQAEELTKQFNALRDQRVDVTISATLAAMKLTEEQAKERLAAIEAETKALQEGLLVTGQSEEHLESLRMQINRLGVEAEVLNQSMQQIKARDLAADFKELAKIEQEVAVLQQEHNDKLKELNQERLAAEIKAAIERGEAIAEAERDAQNARIEAARDRDNAIAENIRDAQIDREELEADHQKNLIKIAREFNRSREQAIQDRDAVALDAAERKRNDDLRDEEEGYKERRQQLERNLQEENRKINQRYQEQIRNIDARLAEQVRNIDLRYQQQLQTIANANAQAIAAENARYQKEYQLKINAVNTLLGIEAQGVKSTLALHTQFWQYAVQLAKNAGLSIAGIASGKPAQLSNTGQAPPGTGTPIPPMASGGFIQREGLAYLHAGETVIPARGQGGAGGVTINIAGAQEQMLTAKTYKQTMQIVGTTLKRMGMR